MKIMNTVFTDHLGVETRLPFQSQYHAIETLAMQHRRAAEEPNSQSVSPVVRRRQRKYTLTPIPNRSSNVTAVGSGGANAIGGADTEQPGQVEPIAGGGADAELSGQVEPIAIGGADTERSGQVEPTAVGGAGTVAAGRHRMRKGGEERGGDIYTQS